jgi:hypothetical protein
LTILAGTRLAGATAVFLVVLFGVVKTAMARLWEISIVFAVLDVCALALVWVAWRLLARRLR